MMRKPLLFLSALAILFSGIRKVEAQSFPVTSHYSYCQPPQGATGWGTCYNSALASVDTQFWALSHPYQGAWSISTLYSAGQFVTYGSTLYLSTVDFNSGQTPGTGSNWQSFGTSGGGTTAPGGSPFSAQYNAAGAFGGASIAGLSWYSTSAIPRAATVADVVSLWTTCGAGYMKGDGTCGTPAGGATPGGAAFSFQYNAAGSFGGVAVAGIVLGSTTAAPRAATASDLAGLGVLSNSIAGNAATATSAATATNATQIGGVAVSGTPATGYVPTATGATTATWQAPSGGYTLTASAVASVITAQSGCSTAGYVWLPQSNTCVAQSGGGSAYPPAGIPNSTGTSYGASYAAPTGALVGTTDTQTLTNKTIDGVSPTTMTYVDPTSSVQTQLNSKASAGALGTAAAKSSSLLINGTDCSLTTGGTTCNPPGTVTPTSGDLLVSTKTNGQVTSLKRINALVGIGDSYMQGVGVSNQTLDGSFYLLVRDTPNVSWANLGHQGDTTPEIAFKAFGVVTYDPSLPNVYYNDGGLNDGANEPCGGAIGTNCMKNYQLSMQALEVRESVPETYRVYASNATFSGANAFDGTVPLAPPSNGMLSYGSGWAIANTGATMTFSVPSSAASALYVTYPVTNGNTSTFSVSIDGGPLKVDYCSGTTTFSTGPCGGQALVGTSTAPFTQRFPVTPGISHTVVVSALGSTSYVAVISVDWAPPSSYINGQFTSSVTNVNGVFMQSSPVASGFAYAANYSTAAGTISNQLHTDGLPVYFVDLTNGTPGADNAIYFSTTPTTTCAATTLSGHLNLCGQSAAEQTVFNTEVAAGWQFSSFNAGGQSVYRSGKLAVPLNLSLQDNGTLASVSNSLQASGAVSMDCHRFTSGYPFGCFGFITGDVSTGKPWSGLQNTAIASPYNGWVGFYQTDSSGSSDPSHFIGVGGVDLGTGNTSFNGVDSRKLGAVAASASSVTLTGYITHISGTNPIDTLVLPANYSSTFGGCLAIVADGAVATTTAGNIFAIYSLAAGSLHQACYDGSKWYIE